MPQTDFQIKVPSLCRPGAGENTEERATIPAATMKTTTPASAFKPLVQRLAPLLLITIVILSSQTATNINSNNLVACQEQQQPTAVDDSSPLSRIAPDSSTDQSQSQQQVHRKQEETPPSPSNSTEAILNELKRINDQLLTGQPAADLNQSSVPKAGGSSDATTTIQDNNNDVDDDRERDDESADNLTGSMNLMNAAQDKLIAVKSLLDVHQQQQLAASADNGSNSSTSEQQQHQHPTPASADLMQCTHKGHQYSHGQTVFIEDQPCLNCTCKMAILQCYLRVCPPIVSLEAQKRKALQLATGSQRSSTSGDHQQQLDQQLQDCRLVKEAHQCCPVMKCSAAAEPKVVDNSTKSPTDANSQQQQSGRLQPPSPSPGSSSQQQQNSPVINRSINSPVDSQPSKVASDQAGAASSIVATSVQAAHTNSYHHHHHQDGSLPKLTVINGPAGQRDSILLITSNPHSSSFKRQFSNSTTSSQGSADTGGQAEQAVVSSAPIIEALLETIYSSAANQLSGLNLHGSCMINGSLYFEGSAVLPDSAGQQQQQCQYCYCIRQKVMCVKPRCHLIISGCTPKYSNEFACCPTSYACDSPNSNSLAQHTSSNSLARLTSAGSTQPTGSSSALLPVRLSAAFEEAISRVLTGRNHAGGPTGALVALPSPVPEPPPTQYNSLDTELTARQVDGAGASIGQQQQQQAPAEDKSLRSMINSLLANFAPAEPLNGPATTSGDANETAAAAVGPMVKTTATLTTIVTTTNKLPDSDDYSTTTMTSSHKPGADFNEGLNDSDNDAEDEHLHEGTKPKRKSGNNKRVPSSTISTTTSSIATMSEGFSTPSSIGGIGTSSTALPVQDSGALQQTTTTSTPPRTTTQQSASSVADFLEPMNKLGPHMSSPTTPSGCTENGRNYAIGEQIPTLESCKHCYCGPEGVKECKMVECNLRGAHGCKPITPEGHCCPIRFDCGSPPQGADSGNDRTGDRPVPVVKTTRLVLDDDEDDERHRNSFGETTTGARYPISGDNVPPTQANSSEPTPNMAGLTEELNQFIMRIRANNSSGGAGAGSTEAAQQQQRSPLLPANNEGSSFSNEPANLSSLTSHDDASSFDEHQDGSPERHDQLSGANRKRDYDSFKPATAAAAVPIPPGMVGIPSIEPAIIGNLAPSAASRALDSSDDLLSTVAPLSSLSEPNKTGSGGGSQRDMRSTHAHAGSAGHLHGETLSTVIDQPSPTSNSTAARPPSSTSSGSSDDYVDLDDAEPTAGRNHQDHTDSKELAVRYQLDELNNNNNSTTSSRNEAELVHVRRLRDDRINANHGHRHLEEGHQTSTSSPAPAAVVDFDDDTASSNSSSSSSNGAGSTEANVSDTLPAQPPSHQSTSSAADEAARAEQGGSGQAADAQDNSVSSTPSSALQPTTGSPIGVNLSDRPVTPEMSGWIKLLPQWTRSFGQRLSGLDSFQGAATTGQQPNEQLQHQYGRSNPYATARLVAENVSLPIVSTASRALDQPARESARSTHQNPFMSMLRSIIATAAASQPSGGGDRELKDKTDSADQQSAASNDSVGQPRRSGNLVMRPLAPAEWQSSLIQDSREPVGNVNENNRADNSIFQSRALSSTFEPSLSPSELEIVTAAVPNEPEVFGQTRRVPPPRAGSADTKELVVMASSSFARRSDVADSMDTGPEDSTVPVISGKRQGQDQEASVQYFANLAPAGGPRQSGGSNGAAVSHQQRAPFHFVQVHKLNRASDNQVMQSGGGGGGGNQRGASLTCYDSATNKTYQLNERIPKLDEPCKACTCLLGREICQPLVCPEKPADNCREEHRPGECCPNYLCATGLGPVASSPPVAGTSEAPAPASATSQPSHSGRLISVPQATSSGQARNLTPTMDGSGQRTTNNQPSASAGAAQGNFRPPSSGFQIRTGDLASLLPPHLRFRPNQQHQQGAAVVASGPQANQLSQSGQRQFLFNYDNNNQQLSFSNNEQAMRQRQQQQQSGQRIFVNNNNNNNQQLSLMGAGIGTGQNDARYRPMQGIQSATSSYLSGPNSPVVRPSLLMHPQRFIQSVAASRRNDDSPVINLNSIQTNQIVSTGGSHESKLTANQAQQVAANPAAGSSTNQALITNFITNNLNQQPQPQQQQPLQHPLANQVSSMRFPVPTDNRQQQQVVPVAVRLTNSGQASGGGNREPALTPTSWKLPMSSLDSNPTSMLLGQVGTSFQQHNPASQPKQVAMMKPPPMATSMNSIAPIAHSGPSVSRPPTGGALDQPTAINMLATSDSNKPAQMDKILFKQSQQQKQSLPTPPSPPMASFAATNAASPIQRQFTTTTTPDTPPFGANFDSGFRPIVGPQEQPQLIVKTNQEQAVPSERPLPVPPSTTTTSATTIESSLATSSGASSMGSTPTSTTRFQVPDSTPTSTSTIRYSQPLDSTSGDESRAPEATTSESPHSQSLQPTNGQTSPAGAELGQQFNIADDSTTASPSTTTTSTTTTTTPPPPPTTTTFVTSPSSMAPAVSVQPTTANAEDDRKTSFGPASSTQTAAVGQLGNEESASNLPASSGQDEPTEAPLFDPFAFRVSECDIYGRVYKVGQPIDELSDSCKRCTCTASGVDCQTKC